MIWLPKAKRGRESMSTVAKGSKLENEFFQYLIDQKSNGLEVYDLYGPDACKIYKSKRYYDREREAHVTFDVVIEVFRRGADTPHLFVVFECKNHTGPLKETLLTDFSDKLTRIFPHRVKGVIVTSSRLQSGAQKIASSRGIGIVKYCDGGFEIVAERTENPFFGPKYVASQLFERSYSTKQLKFSAFNDGAYFASLSEFLGSLARDAVQTPTTDVKSSSPRSSYFLADSIQHSVRDILVASSYLGGPVDLEKICDLLSVKLIITNQKVLDADGNKVLGQANFDKKSITINLHEDKNRERFTLAHEIGHFCLNHGRYLRSEYILKRDLLIGEESRARFKCENLEIQANIFASTLLLPEGSFVGEVARLSQSFNLGNNLRGRERPYIFVDNQRCNFEPYNKFLLAISTHFAVSKMVVEIRLKNLGLLTDERIQNGRPSQPVGIGELVLSEIGRR